MIYDFMNYLTSRNYFITSWLVMTFFICLHLTKKTMVEFCYWHFLAIWCTLALSIWNVDVFESSERRIHLNLHHAFLNFINIHFHHPLKGATWCTTFKHHCVACEIYCWTFSSNHQIAKFLKGQYYFWKNPTWNFTRWRFLSAWFKSSV